MALSRTFKETVCARAQTDSDYGHRMLQEAVQNLVEGDIETAKSMLQLYVNATVGFQALGRAMDMAPQSLTRMLGPDGNPRANNLAAMLAFLQEDAGVELTVQVRETPNAETSPATSGEAHLDNGAGGAEDAVGGE